MILHRRLRVPRRHGSLLADPPLESVGHLLTQSLPDSKVFGRPLHAWREQTRVEALATARTYLAEKGEEIPAFDSSAPLLVGGHQPELFHPGVWVKNFAINQMARVHQAVPLHLIVDNDNLKSSSLRVPVWQGSEAYADNAGCHLASLPLDDWTGEVPHEERKVIREDLFESLPTRLRAVTANWPFQPLALNLWPKLPREQRLDERLSSGRRLLERAWGCVNLELPLSRLCESNSFAQFALGIMADVERFHAEYNECVRAYRKVHGIRSRNHPVPDLSIEEGWYELPFWIWKADASRRGRLFVRRAGSSVELRAENIPCCSVRLDADELSSLLKEGWKLRTRALTTTLFTRLFLAGLFVHGIGGGKYDEVTNELLERYFKIVPPPFVVLSATVLLPFASDAIAGTDVAELERLQRDLIWNPQRHLHREAATPIVRDKEAWIARLPHTKEEKRGRFATLRQLTEQLRPFVFDRIREVQADLSESQRHLATRELLSRRDFSFCLYPEETLRTFYSRLVATRL